MVGGTMLFDEWRNEESLPSDGTATAPDGEQHTGSGLQAERLDVPLKSMTFVLQVAAVSLSI